MSDVDTVVIGSGAGGLTAALALARSGEKVLVLEQHDLPGGWCHSFDLEGYTFSPGVHYIGELGDGGRMRAIYEGLGVAGDLTFLELDPDGFDRVRIGADFAFDIPRGKERYVDRLCTRFPGDARGIRTFLDIVERLHHELMHGLKLRGPLGVLGLPLRAPTLVRYGFRTVSSVLEPLVKDPYARAVLSMQAGDHGMAPSRCAMALHAAVVGHYFDGGFYPKGGARALPKAFLKALRRHGGQIKVKSRVSRILVEGGKAIGVALADGTEVRARRVISNADPRVTYGLLPADAVPWRVRRRLERTTWGISAMSLFLAADLDARRQGMTSGNVWWTSSPDVEEGYRYATDPEPLKRGPLPGLFLTCTTLKDPSERADGVSTFEAFSFVSNDAFRTWDGTAFGARPPEYEAFKAAFAERMLDRIDALVPGLRERVVFRSAATPLTNRHYVEATEGSLYGTEKRRRQLLGFPLRTPIDGLYMCGASTLGHGVAGATMSGLSLAQHLLGVRRSELLSEKGAPLRVLSAEHPETWPGAEQRVA